jgi:carbonic anhydrase
MKAGGVLEKFLTAECKANATEEAYNACVVCASSTACRFSAMFPGSYMVSNACAQVIANLTSIYYAVKDLKVPLVAVILSTKVNLEKFVSFNLQAAEVEFKLLRRTYEDNAEILLPLYEEDSSNFNTALIEINIDAQIDKLLSIPEFEAPTQEGRLTICGFVLDETGSYGKTPSLYLTNLNGMKDPEEIKASPLMSEIPQAVKESKVKRLHIQL